MTETRDPLRVEVHLHSSSEPIVYLDAISCFEKGSLFCVAYDQGSQVMTDKYPIMSIFRVRNTYTGKEPRND